MIVLLQKWKYKQPLKDTTLYKTYKTPCCTNFQLLRVWIISANNSPPNYAGCEQNNEYGDKCRYHNEKNVEQIVLPHQIRVNDDRIITGFVGRRESDRPRPVRADAVGAIIGVRQKIRARGRGQIEVGRWTSRTIPIPRPEEIRVIVGSEEKIFLAIVHHAWLKNTRVVDVKKRTATTHSCTFLYGIRFGHNMSNCPFSFSFIGHIFV